MIVFVVTYAGYEDMTVHRYLETAKQALQDALETNGGEWCEDCEKWFSRLEDRKLDTIDYGYFPDGTQGAIERCKLED